MCLASNTDIQNDMSVIPKPQSTDCTRTGQIRFYSGCVLKHHGMQGNQDIRDHQRYTGSISTTMQWTQCSGNERTEVHVRQCPTIIGCVRHLRKYNEPACSTMSTPKKPTESYEPRNTAKHTRTHQNTTERRETQEIANMPNDKQTHTTPAQRGRLLQGSTVSLCTWLREFKLNLDDIGDVNTAACSKIKETTTSQTRVLVSRGLLPSS